MKSLKNILGRKKIGKASFLDEKTVEGILFSALQKEAKNIDRSDIKEVKFKDKMIIIKTIHPAVASEIWRKRESVIAWINEEAGNEIIEKLIAK
jgi:hypothetical protein